MTWGFEYPCGPYSINTMPQFGGTYASSHVPATYAHNVVMTPP